MALPSPQREPPAPAATLRVLIVEDNAADAMVAQAAVARAANGPFATLRAGNAARALELLASDDVHLVLLDLNLPDSRGLDTLRRVRVATRAPLIVVTSEDTPGLDEAALEEGAYEILHKGRVDVEAIARLLRLAEGQRRTQRRLEATEQASRNKLRRNELRFRGLTELASDWYWEQDDQYRFTYLSPGFAERTGVDPSRMLGRRRWDSENVIPVAGAWKEHRATLEARQSFRGFVQVSVDADGSRQYIESNGMPDYDEAGNFTGYCGVSWNITARMEAERAIERMARFDPVTGLPNRNLIKERLEQAIAQAQQRGRGAGVLLLDLDRFKLINDSLGHQTGDALLAQVGLSLKDCVRREDTVGRLGGDEFVVVLADLARPEDAADVAGKILASFAAPFDLDEQETFITASIGVATFPQDGDDAEMLLQRADAAMGRVKESTRNAHCFFTEEMNARTAAKLQLNIDLRRALERAEYELYYQPKVRLADGVVVGLEALLRWRHPERGLVPPAEFVPTLEDTGMIVAVGDWVIGEACRQLQRWAGEGLTTVPIAVNVSPRQFERGDLQAAIERHLRANAVGPGLLELELTESCLMSDPEDAARQLQRLRDAGLRISVDDFGTGYSSLAYLTRLPLSALKIDRGFVDAAISDPHSAAIVRLVIDMALRLRFDVVAEGIETAEHVGFLRKHGCELGQGYLFGKPAPAREIAQRLGARAATPV